MQAKAMAQRHGSPWSEQPAPSFRSFGEISPVGCAPEFQGPTGKEALL
jgi:hypothetical protein